MKKFLPLVFTFAFIIVGFTTQAQSNADFQLSSLSSKEALKDAQITTQIHSKGKRVSINMNNTQDRIYSVKIKNEAGIPQQSYTSRSGKVNLEMDLQILPKGKYLLAIMTKKKKIITYEFSK